MEVLLLYWDNLDDYLGALRLKAEAVRKFIGKVLRVTLAVPAACGALWMTVKEPAFGAATITMLFVIFLYYRVTAPAPVAG
jgi:hypothetical protein